MGVNRKYVREGHDFQQKTLVFFFSFFAREKQNGIFCEFSVFETKLGAFNTRQENKIIMKKYGNFRCFRLNLGVVKARAEVEKDRVFYRGTAYDVIIFRFQRGGLRPSPPTSWRPWLFMCLQSSWDQRLRSLRRADHSARLRERQPTVLRRSEGLSKRWPNRW